MTDFLKHLVIEEVSSESTPNSIPIFVLPDATGSSDALLELGKRLNRPIIFFRDGRFSSDYTGKIDLDITELAESYRDAILSHKSLQQAHGYPSTPYHTPIIIIGYSGGGILLKHIEQLLSEKIPPSHVRSIYLDSVSPSAMHAIPINDMADHFVDFMKKLSAKYIDKTWKLKLNDILELLNSCQTIEKQIEYLLQLSRKNPSQFFIMPDSLSNAILDDSSDIESFARAMRVMLHNHLAYYKDRSSLSIHPSATFIATDNTIQKCKQYFQKSEGCSLLGWNRDYNLKHNFYETDFIIEKADHYSVLTDNKLLTSLASIINNQLPNDAEIRKTAAFTQPLYSLILCKKQMEDDPALLSDFQTYVQNTFMELLKDVVGQHVLIKASAPDTDTKSTEFKTMSPSNFGINLSLFAKTRNKSFVNVVTPEKQSANSAETLEMNIKSNNYM